MAKWNQKPRFLFVYLFTIPKRRERHTLQKRTKETNVETREMQAEREREKNDKFIVALRAYLATENEHNDLFSLLYRQRFFEHLDFVCSFFLFKKMGNKRKR